MAKTRKGRVRAELARMAMEAHEKGRVQVALARAPDFYGHQWEGPYHFNHDKFERAFGKQPVTPHRDAVRETVKWFRENPKKA
ncbi:MAG TPA: hypothetical protein VF794_07170 [Archangium sp.]|uniref:hypothetical protein n=1 Tax=Archangium sp. TaxID=1872627 RepID=UPI002ED96268